MAAWFALTQGRYQDVLIAAQADQQLLGNHFQIDPNKWDFYVMDGHRLVGDDERA